MRATHRLRVLVVGALGLALVIGVGVLGMSTAKRLGLIGPGEVPHQYRALVLKSAELCPKVPVEVLAAQLANESGWDARALSPAGAQGIAQFMPQVWDQVGRDANGDGRADVWDPEDAIPSAAAFNCRNRQLVKGVSGSRLRNTLAAYNAGFAAVRKYGGVPPFPETQAYVSRIMADAKAISW
jgi:soluble lytic murein transglycosylase-like protein